MSKKEFTPTDVCKEVGISKNTLFRWEREGLIPSAKRDWKGWRVFSEEDLQEVLKVKNTRSDVLSRGRTDEK